MNSTILDRLIDSIKKASAFNQLASASVASFMIHSKRSKEAFKQLIDDWEGILVSDGYRLCTKWVGLRQTCWLI